jgi:signal transduction histidine kinase
MGIFQDRLAGSLRPGPASDATREPGAAGQVTRQRVGREIAIVAAACVVSLAVASGDKNGVLRGWHGYPWPLRAADVVFAAIGYVGLWWRQRWPLAFAGYIAVTSVFSTLTGGLPFIAAFVVASRRNWPTALVTSALLTAAAWPSLLLYPDGSSSNGAAMLTVAAVMCAVTGWGMFLRARRQLLDSLRSRAQRAEQSREEHAEHAKLAERQRIAREMHDVLAHRLSLLAVQAGALEVTPAAPADGAGDGAITEAAAAVRATTHQALDELRSIVRVLRDGSEGSTSPPAPCAADLPALVTESAAATAVHADWGGVDLAAVPAQTGRTLYRIIQEG